MKWAFIDSMSSILSLGQLVVGLGVNGDGITTGVGGKDGAAGMLGGCMQIVAFGPKRPDASTSR